MKLFARISAEENANLAAKIIEAHEQAKKELRPYLMTYLRSQALSEAEKSMLNDENLVNIKIDQADISESYALKVNAISVMPQQSKSKEITDFIGDAIKSVLSNMKSAQSAIKEENYFGVLENSMKANKAIGCLEMADKLNLFNKFVKKQKEDKTKAGKATRPYLPQVKEIVLLVAARSANSYQFKEKLFNQIAAECHDEIKTKLNSEAISWQEENFARTFIMHTKSDKEFGESIKLLLKKIPIPISKKG